MAVKWRFTYILKVLGFTDTGQPVCGLWGQCGQCGQWTVWPVCGQPVRRTLLDRFLQAFRKDKLYVLLEVNSQLPFPLRNLSNELEDLLLVNMLAKTGVMHKNSVCILLPNRTLLGMCSCASTTIHRVSALTQTIQIKNQEIGICGV